ncbi:MAG: ATP-binding cassette domain-containing protein, partial [Limnohabitans sp.]|nr:ATP-binding cassette domain-containing protein [Limnohabitans sp.]
MSRSLIQLQNVGHQFGSHWALQSINLQIEAGERVALIGANGCGKSTLLRVMHQLIKPTQGGLWVSDQHKQAMLFQRPHMLRMSVLSHVALGLRLQGQTQERANELASKELERMHLSHLAHQFAPTLSGGQQQRISLARTWTMQPQILLLDEPTSNLDPQAKRNVEASVSQYVSQPIDGQNVMLIFSSHNLGQVKRLASRVLYVEQGQILADLPVDLFFNSDLKQTHPQAHQFLKGE